MEITDFDDFSEKLSVKMSNSYRERKKNTRTLNDSTFVKSYIVNCTLLNDESTSNDIIYILKNNIIENVEIKKVRDCNLFIITKDRLTMYLDVKNKNFLKFSTMNRVKDSDEFISNLLKRKGFNRIYLSSAFMKNFIKDFYLYGFKASFTDLINKNDFFSNDNCEYNLELNKGENLLSYNFLNELEDEKFFNEKLCLKKIEILYGDSLKEFVIEDIKSDGKVTSRGNSFKLHDEILDYIINYYDKILKNLSSLEDKNIILNFKRDNIDNFNLCKYIFTGKEPFKIAGYLNKISYNHVIVNAVDLNTDSFGEKMDFELIDKTILISRRNIGDIRKIIRFFCNFSGYIDSNVCMGSDELNDLHKMVWREICRKNISRNCMEWCK